MRKFIVEIEVFDVEEDKWAQARYLAHGYDDVLWTNSIESALTFLKDQIELSEKSI